MKTYRRTCRKRPLFGHRNLSATRSESNALETGRDTWSTQESREEVLHRIGEIIEWLYDHGLNPIPVLADALRRYNWTFIMLNPDNEAEVRNLKPAVEKCDFAWFYQRIFITATRRGKAKNFHKAVWIASVQGMPNKYLFENMGAHIAWDMRQPC